MLRVFGLVLVLGCGARALGAQASVPAVPEHAANPAAFVPSGWQILKEAAGDLNTDGKEDRALILKETGETDDPETWEKPRLLLLLFKEENGYRLSGRSAQLILCRGCGGVFGDPLEKIAIERGTLVVTHYGGSRDRWGYTHRFRFQDGNWFLIGRTRISHDTLSQESHETDENLITGDVVQIDRDQAGKESRKKSRRKPAPLVRLRDVRIGE